MSVWTARLSLMVTVILVCAAVGQTPSTVSVTQDVYQREEHGNVTLTWLFPVNTDVSTASLYVDIVYGKDMRGIYLYDSQFGGELYMDEHYRRRMWCDLELARTGRIECLFTGLRLSDSGTYNCIVVINGESHYKACCLSVTAASHQPMNGTTEPASRGRIGLCAGFGLFTAVAAALIILISIISLCS